MKFRLILPLLLATTTTALADPHPGDGGGGARNKDGSVVTGVLTARFDPANGVLPFPSNLLYLGSTDLTLNPPVADPADKSDPAVALSALDGFSNSENWVTTFVDNDGNPGAIDPASVVPGQSVRVFQVTAREFVAVTGIVRELTPGADFVATVAEGGVLAIVPLKPLPEYSTFMAVLTNDIKDAAGNDATPDQTYFLTKRQEPWIDAGGNSTYPLIDDETAQTLEQLRQITSSMEAAAASAGVPPDEIILAWTMQTQSVTPTLKLLRSVTEPAPVQAALTGQNTQAVGGFGLADIAMGVITLPYYLGEPSQANPTAPLTDNWEASPGAYVPPFDQLGLDPTSTNLTVANPFPAVKSMQTVPFVLAVPSAASGFEQPAEGWPVVIYAHGITRNRTDVLGMADAIASAGYAVIAIDHPLHGVVPEVEPQLAPFYIENTPFGAIADERTFEVDYFDNATGALSPDGIPDASGSSYFNLLNLQAVRDNLRQSQADLSVLAASLQNIDIDGDQMPDLNTFDVGFVGHSYGAFIGVPFLAVEPIVSRAYLNAGGAVLIRSAEAGSFGVRIRALLSAAGIEAGTPEFEQFLTVAQTVAGSADATGWAVEASLKMPILHNQVQGDSVVPNTVSGSPMAGNEGLNALLGLTAYSQSQMSAEGFSGVGRFAVGEHGSLISPTFPEVTAEMQGQLASFIASQGTFVSVESPELLVPVMDANAMPSLVRELREDAGGSRYDAGTTGDRKNRIRRGEQPDDLIRQPYQ